MSTGLLPVFLKLAGRRVLVVGGGPVAASKIETLLASGARVTVVAPDIVSDIAALPIDLVRRGFEDRDLDGCWFVVAAATPEINRAVAAAAEPRHVFVNAVDDPPNATAYLGGVVRKDGVLVAISTEGRAPALAGLLREAIERVLPDDVGRWLDESDACRARWKAAGVPMASRRPQLLEAINALYDERREEAR